MVNTKEKLSFKKQVALKVLASIIVMLIIALTGLYDKLSINMIGGASIDDLNNRMIPPPVQHVEKLTDGTFIRHHTTDRRTHINWGKDEDLMLKMGLEPMREMFVRNIKITHRTLLELTVHAGCRYDSSGKQKKFAASIARITVNGIEKSKDTSPFSGTALFNLHSTARATLALLPGDYQVIGEGLWCGPVDLADADMLIKMTINETLSWRQYKKIIRSGYHSVTYRMDLKERAGPIHNFYNYQDHLLASGYFEKMPGLFGILAPIVPQPD